MRSSSAKFKHQLESWSLQVEKCNPIEGAEKTNLIMIPNFMVFDFLNE